METLFSGEEMLIRLVLEMLIRLVLVATTTISTEANSPCSSHTPAAAFTVILKTKRRMLTSSDNWDIYIWLPCVGGVGEPHIKSWQKQTLGTSVLVYTWPLAGWQQKVNKQNATACLPPLWWWWWWGGPGWMDGFNYSLVGCVYSHLAQRVQKK